MPPTHAARLRQLLEELAALDATSPKALEQLAALQAEAKFLLRPRTDKLFDARKLAVEARLADALERDKLYLPTIKQMVADGASLRLIAQALDAKGFPPPAGDRWSYGTVRLIIKRHGLTNEPRQ